MADHVTFKLHWTKRLLKPGSPTLTITKTRVVYRAGLLSRDEMIVPINRITDVRMTQGCLGNILNVGNLYIETAGSGKEIIIQGLDNPRRARSIILRLMESQ